MSTDATLYDVLAIAFASYKVRFLTQEVTLENAQAVVSMAVIRRGVDEEFYVEVPAGSYQEGEQWTGQKVRAK